MNCKHCGRQVDDYDLHFPMCSTVRIACDDTYWVGLVDQRRRSSPADKLARRATSVRNQRARERRNLAERRRRVTSLRLASNTTWR